MGTSGGKVISEKQVELGVRVKRIGITILFPPPEKEDKEFKLAIDLKDREVKRKEAPEKETALSDLSVIEKNMVLAHLAYHDAQESFEQAKKEFESKSTLLTKDWKKSRKKPKVIAKAEATEVFSQVTVGDDEKIIPFTQPTEENSKCVSGMIDRLKKKTMKKPDGKDFSVSDLDQFQKIGVFREMLSCYSKLLDEFLEQDADHKNAILEKILEQLSVKLDKKHDVDSDDTVQCENDVTSFSLPWINEKSDACFEFGREKDGSCFLTIHNRGRGIENEEIHGPIKFKVNDKIVTKTSVRMQFKGENPLKDEDFLTELFLLFYLTKDIKDVYNFILEELVRNERVDIVISDQERKILDKLEELDAEDLSGQERMKLQQELTQLQAELLEKDLHYDTIQRYGTHNNSSLTLPEKFLSKTNVDKYVRVFSLVRKTTGQLTKNLENIKKSCAKEYDPKILSSHKWKLKTAKEFKEISDISAKAA